MTEVNQLKQLFAYDRWANGIIADVLRQASFAERSEAIGLLAHIVAAQQVWLRRIRGKSAAGLALWPGEADVSTLAEQADALHGRWLQLLGNADFHSGRRVRYQNSGGEIFNNALGGILHHVIIHGQHHRAQIAAQLRSAGITPPATDFIFYLRQSDD